MNYNRDQYWQYILKILTILLSLVTLYFLFVYFIPVFLGMAGSAVGAMLPFLAALVIAILLDPIVDWLVEKKGLKRGLAVIFTLSIMLVLTILLIILVTSRLIIELTDLYHSMPYYSQELMKYLMEYIKEVRNYFSNNPLPLEAQDALRSNLQAILNQSVNMVSLLSNWLFAFVKGLPGFITIILVASVATFFVSRDKAAIAGFMYSIIPRRFIKPTSAVIGEMSKALVGFFRAQTILISISTILTIIGLNILQVNYALTVGILVGLLDLLPILGPGLVFIPWVLFVLLLGQFRLGIGLLILYGIVIGVRQLIEPKILSQHIGLHPLATLISLYLGLQLLGVWGIIIGPFLVIVAKAIIKTRRIDNGG
jgi:sporulation integral membrane protein YtvI